jgi:nicotinamide phosphoribosyltransferase
VVRVLEILGEKFGCSINSKGYRVLCPKVRVIQGDGIDFAMLGRILSAMQDAGWSADNLTFGSGGGLLQKLNRDTQRFAFKCSSARVNGQERDVFKQPITDSGKRSKAGRMKLVLEQTHTGSYLKTVPASDPREDQMRVVFRNGELIMDQTLANVRDRSAKGIITPAGE